MGMPRARRGPRHEFRKLSAWDGPWVEVRGLLRLVHGVRDDRNPFVHDRRDAVTNNATPAVEFKGGSAEEAASGKEAFLNQNQPLLHQTPQARHPPGCGKGRAGNLLYKNHASRLDGG